MPILRPATFAERSSVSQLPKRQVVADASPPGVTQSESPNTSLIQCVACEYAGCICIVVVTVVPTVTAIADSSNIEKIMTFFISNYKDLSYLSSIFHRLGRMTEIKLEPGKKIKKV
jgi:hypothetical protein